MDAEDTPFKGNDMAELGNDQIDRLLFLALNIHSEAFPEVDPGVAGSRASLRRFLMKRLNADAALKQLSPREVLAAMDGYGLVITDDDEISERLESLGLSRSEGELTK